MTATRKAKRDEMLAVEKRKLVRLVKAQIELWAGRLLTVGAQGFYAEVSTIAGLCTFSVSVFGSGAIFGRFHEPERAVKAGVTMVDSYNGKWMIFFGRVTADVAAMQFVNALSGFIGKPAEWTLPPPPPSMFVGKPLPPRDPNYVSPFAGTTKELCSDCLQPFERARDCNSGLCLRCAWAALEYEREVSTEALSNEEEADRQVDELKKEKRELYGKLKEFADGHRGPTRDALEVILKEMLP